MKLFRVLIIFTLAFSMLFFFSCEKEAEDEKPTYVSSTPAKNASNVSLNTVVSITFSEPIVLATPHNIKINGVGADVIATDKVLTFNNKLKSGIEYTILIPTGAIKDAAGNSVSPFALRFTTEAVVSISPNLVTADPIPQAVKLYDFLKENYGKKSISSSMANVSWNTNEAEWIKSQTGKYPAMNTYDLIFLHASWNSYNDMTGVEKWWADNGIVSLCWHWNVPLTENSTSYSFRYVGQDGATAANGTVFDVSQAVIEGTKENIYVKADMDKAIVVLKKLQDKGIPALWRPLHESSGQWFWWSAKGAEPTKKLWRMMFNYFKDKGIRNLIWVWTLDVKETDNAWYPGDEYVDIVSRDIYSRPLATDNITQFNTVQKRHLNKMVALSEFGNVAKLSEQWTGGAKWSYFMPWYDFNRTNILSEADFLLTDHQWANAAWWKDAMAVDNVITRDEMPSLK